jgi:hypothetical protein
MDGSLPSFCHYLPINGSPKPRHHRLNRQKQRSAVRRILDELRAGYVEALGLLVLRAHKSGGEADALGGGGDATSRLPCRNAMQQGPQSRAGSRGIVEYVQKRAVTFRIKREHALIQYHIDCELPGMRLDAQIDVVFRISRSA